jgi:hypothetical protein
MSSKRTLQEFDVAAPNREPVDGQTPSRDLSALESDGDCRNCGAVIDSDALRVVGDNDDMVPVCPACVETKEGNRYYTVTTAVAHYRRGNAYKVGE